MEISISPGNHKMGAIPSVSLPAVLTCRGDCACKQKCYAKKLERLRRTVREAYARNLNILTNSPDTYWREVEATVMVSRFFRFHVSGDIPNAAYFEKMVEIANRNPHCEILCFTKRYSTVNSYIESHGALPKNLHMVFSAWKGLAMENPFRLPEAHVLYRDGTTTASADAKPCGGNCAQCCMHDCGCWSLQSGEQVVFKEH